MEAYEAILNYSAASGMKNFNKATIILREQCEDMLLAGCESGPEVCFDIFETYFKNGKLTMDDIERVRLSQQDESRTTKEIVDLCEDMGITVEERVKNDPYEIIMDIYRKNKSITLDDIKRVANDNDVLTFEELMDMCKNIDLMV